MNAHGYFRVGARSSYGGAQPEPMVPQPRSEPEKKGILAKAVSWIKAEASMIASGPLSDEQYALRIEQCLSCPLLDRHPDADRIGWCKACGCGRKSRAELTVKGRMPKSTCPKGRWPDPK
jgi:hypothetical protein